MKKAENEIRNKIKSRVGLVADINNTRERDLKRFDNSRKSNELFKLGYEWAINGFSLEEYDDKEISSAIHFIRGFERGSAFKAGYDIGISGESLDNLSIDPKMNNYRYFKEGFEAGMAEFKYQQINSGKGRK